MSHVAFCSIKQHSFKPFICLDLIGFCFCSLRGSPWYNRTGWLGVKHQLTYLLTLTTGSVKLSKHNTNLLTYLLWQRGQSSYLNLSWKCGGGGSRRLVLLPSLFCSGGLFRSPHVFGAFFGHQLRSAVECVGTDLRWRHYVNCPCV